jgi:hypothetical protein
MAAYFFFKQFGATFWAQRTSEAHLQFIRFLFLLLKMQWDLHTISNLLHKNGCIALFDI